MKAEENGIASENYLKKVKIEDTQHPVYDDGRIIGTLNLSYFFDIYAKQAIKELLDDTDGEIKRIATKELPPKFEWLPYKQGLGTVKGDVNISARNSFIKGAIAFRDKLKEQTNGTD